MTLFPILFKFCTYNNGLMPGFLYTHIYNINYVSNATLPFALTDAIHPFLNMLKMLTL